MGTFFRKVSVKERLPESCGIFREYITDLGTITLWQCPTGDDHFKRWQKDKNSCNTLEPKWWLEEVNFPSDEEIEKMFPNISIPIEAHCVRQGKQVGAKYMRDFAMGNLKNINEYEVQNVC